MTVRLRVLLWSLTTLLLSGYPDHVVLGGPDAPKVLKAKAIPLKEAFTAQFRNHGTLQPVNTEITLGDARFAIQLDGQKLRVATTPGGEAKQAVKSGKTIRFRWKGPDGARTLSLRFVFEDGAWHYHVAAAMRFKLAGQIFLLVDANADGRFDLDRDGWVAGENKVACPLRRRIVLGRRTVEVKALAPDGSTLEVALSPIAGTEMQLEALELVNGLRMAHGLAPVALDPELSKGCTAHAMYLDSNKWTGYTNPHGQTLGPKGASKEGLRAARAAAIRKAPHPRAIDSFYLTYYHRIAMFSPKRDRIGLNSRVPHISVIYTDAPPLELETAVPQYDRPTFVPADGARGVPRQSHEEAPKEPVPDLGSRGFPLMVWIPGGRASGFTGTLHRIVKKRRVEEQVFVVAPARGIAGLVPKSPLKAASLYEATFTWGDTTKATWRIRFHTR